MLIVDTVLYLLLALYFDVVIPGEYGQRRPPYFIFMPSFWKSIFSGKDQKKTPTRQLSARIEEASDDIEPMPAVFHGNEVIRYILNKAICIYIAGYYNPVSPKV